MKKTGLNWYARFGATPVSLAMTALVAGMAGCSGRGSDSNAESAQSKLNANPQATNFAVYAQNSATLRDRVAVSGGDVGVRLAGTAPFVGGAYELVLTADSHVDTARSVIASRVQLLDRARVGDVQVSQLINQNGHFTHQYPFPANLPALPPTAPVTPGTAALTVSTAATLVASPGSYGPVSVGDRGILRLKGGVYHMTSLQVGNDAHIEALAPVQLRVAGRFGTLDRTFIGAAAGVSLTAGDLRIEVSGKNGNSGSLTDSPKAAAFGNDAKVNAVMLVPNGTLLSGQRAIVVGAYVAREVYMDMDSTITYQGGVGPSGCLQACDDGNPCTVDSCSVGVCVHTMSPSGTSCGDGSVCNGAEKCDGAGHCQAGAPVVCAASDQCHVAGTCDPTTGVCSNPAKVDGTACNDGNACTQSDKCQAGVCTGTNPVTCTASDQCHDAGTCDSATGVCSNPAKSNGTICNDGNACTQSDTCQAGVCTGTNPVTCTASDQCHDAGTCDSATGVCSNPAKPNGTICNDGNACTQSDTCQAGVCTGTNPVTCTASDQCHDAGTCNTATGMCSSPAKPAGTACNDGNACTSNDVCTAGACAGTAYTCDDGIACTADSCNGDGTCKHVIAAGSCAINGACYANGATNPADSCQKCDTAKPTAWSNQADGTTCYDSSGCTAVDGGADSADGGGDSADGGANCPKHTCVVGACTGICVPGKLRCNNQTVQACDAAGNWQDVEACVNQACVAGQCAIGTCNADFADCNGIPQDGCETNVATDNLNCGGCGLACVGANSQESCVAGQCTIGTCNAGFADCNGTPQDGCETNVTTDNLNCGGCGLACVGANGQESCVAGQCTIGTCNAGFADCNGTPQDGCETNVATDNLNCGGCGLACVGANGQESCVAGQCTIGTCNAGFADCNGTPQDGCETNVTTDNLNCGGCGLACVGANGQESCVAGQCTIGTCNAGFADCNGTPQDGCETNIATDNLNCGGCGLACVGANGQESCVAGQCTIVATCGPGYIGTNCDQCDAVNGYVDPTSSGACHLCGAGDCGAGIKCTVTGQHTFTCQPDPCMVSLMPPRHGSVTGTTGSTGDTQTYSCDAGYTLIGTATTTCQADHNWSSVAPTCDDLSPPSPGNSGILVTSDVGLRTLSLWWTLATDGSNHPDMLQYAVYLSSSSNIATVSNTLANGTKVLDWASAVYRWDATGLSPNSTYYFNVLVRDPAGNQAAYQMTSVTTQKNIAPVASAGGPYLTALYGGVPAPVLLDGTYSVDANALYDSIVAFEWTAAGDGIGTSACGDCVGIHAVAQSPSWHTGLDYPVNLRVTDSLGAISSISSTKISVVDSVQVPAAVVLDSPSTNVFLSGVAAPISLRFRHPDPVTRQVDFAYAMNGTVPFVPNGPVTAMTAAGGNWVPLAATFDTTPFADGKAYRLKVVATLHSNAISTTVMSPLSFSIDNTAPSAPGASLQSAGTGSSHVILTWNPASDAITPPALLRYTVYYSKSLNIVTPAQAEVSGTKAAGLLPGMHTAVVVGLDSNTQYYFNVVVKDEAGNRSGYTMLGATTLP